MTRFSRYYTSATDNRVVVFDFDGTTLSNEQPVLTGIPKDPFTTAAGSRSDPTATCYA